MRIVVAFAASAFQTLLLTMLIVASSSCSAAPPPSADAPSGAAPAGAAPAGAAAPGGAEPATPTAATAPEGAPAPGSGSAGGGAAATGSTIAKVDAREDAHWVQADDYFMANRAFKQGWLRVFLAKMKEPPKAGGDGEALFFVIRDGGDERSAHFYRTRPAVKTDLVLGALLICFENNKRHNVYEAPKSKDNARPGAWWIGRITDLSDMDKGYATLAGSYHCAPDALRAIVE